MTKKRFLTSWLTASLVMFLLSWIWHGVLLNDFMSINLPFGLFIGLTLLVYLLMGFLLLVLLLFIKPEEPVFLKRLLIGGAFGFFIYLVVFKLGISYLNRGMEHLIIDFTWQMIEQAVGASVLGFSFNVYARMDKIGE